MGKKRIVFIGEEPPRKKKEKQKEPKVDSTVKAVVKSGLPRQVKAGKQHGKIADMTKEVLAEAQQVEKKAKELEKEVLTEAKKTAKVKRVQKPAKIRGKQYQQALKKVDRNKLYPAPEAVILVKRVSLAKFPSSVDVHLNVREAGLRGEIEFPHATGKKQTVRVADEKLLGELERGKINFSLLIATPAIMPKLLKYAKILGPKGLMPNPKAGTITDKPEELVKKLSGVTQFRTEAKSPLIHITVGKTDFPEKHLEENIAALITAVGKKNINKMVIAPTMGPGIKVDLGSIS